MVRIMRLNRNDSVLIAGYRGLVGSALTRKFREKEHRNLLLVGRNEVDLLDQTAVNRYFQTHHVDYAVIAAARVGGIYANSTYPANFLYENLMIAANLIHAAHENNTKKLLFLGSSCIYPKLAPQPIPEDALLTGPLEPTNEAYAIAKIAGLKLCEKYYLQYKKCFISAMPTNLYGIGDNFHPENSHVIPGMFRRFHEAKIRGDSKVTIWGTGTPKREFLFVDDLADALHFLMENYDSPQTINVGTGEEVTIRELAQMMKEITGFRGELAFDTTKPDGTPRKVVDCTRIHKLGWKAKHKLREGLEITYDWVKKNGILDK